MSIVKAKVDNGVVTDCFLIEDIPFPNNIYRQDLVNWITAPEEVGLGWLYDGEKFTPPME
jgi:hypothetical protein